MFRPVRGRISCLRILFFSFIMSFGASNFVYAADPCKVALASAAIDRTLVEISSGLPTSMTPEDGRIKRLRSTMVSMLASNTRATVDLRYLRSLRRKGGTVVGEWTTVNLYKPADVEYDPGAHYGFMGRLELFKATSESLSVHSIPDFVEAAFSQLGEPLVLLSCRLYR